MFEALITLGWIGWGLVMYKHGWRNGITDGCAATLMQLEEKKIIQVDPDTDVISPGTSNSAKPEK